MKLTEIVSSFENFAKLRGYLILWPKDHKNYLRSGMVTAALLNFDDGLTILAIRNDQWITYHLNDEELKDMLSGSPEIVGQSEEDSYILEE